ncbi:Hypothetical predicted protein, partial [Paramuricea clavata]
SSSSSSSSSSKYSSSKYSKYSKYSLFGETRPAEYNALRFSSFGPIVREI